MNKWILSLILILFSFPVFSTKEHQINPETPRFPKGKEAILTEDLKKGKVYGSLEKIVGKKKATHMRLIGHSSFDAPKDKMLVGNKFVLIGWLGVQKIADPSKIVMFKEPIVSSFIVKNDVDTRGVPLPTFGEIEHLIDAIKKLEEDKIDKEDLKKPRAIKIPSGRGSETVLPLRKKNKKEEKKTSTQYLESSNEKPNSEFKNGDERQNLNYSNHSSSYTRNSLNPNSDAPWDSNNAFLSFQNQPRINGERHLINNQSTSEAKEKINPPIKSQFSKKKDFGLYLLPNIDENHLPDIKGDAVVLVKNPNGKHKAYFVRNGVFARDKEGNLIYKEVDVNVERLPILQNSELKILENTEENNDSGSKLTRYGEIEKNEENKERVEEIINDVLFSYKKSEEGQREPIDFGPEITFELTEEGCLPEYDGLQERVTIMARTKKYEDGKLVDIGNCEKTLESYQTKRDYLCEGCQDEINREENKAYARYMEYWIDKSHERHNLGIKLDKESPFKLFEEKEGCGFDAESEEGFAIERSKLGYLNKFGIFKMVENCRISETSKKYPIHDMTQGCHMIHDFLNNVSHEQRRLIFTKDNLEHQAKSCHPFGEPMPHQFIERGCQPIKNPFNKTIIPMFKREIVVSNNFLKRNQQFQHLIITDYCEPEPNTDLPSEWCEGQYVHDLSLARSYLRKRYYFQLENLERKYVTDCIRTNDIVLHQSEPTKEWKHDDTKKVSIPKIGFFIEVPNGKGRLPITGHSELDFVEQKPYQFVRNEQRPTNKVYFEGCFRRTGTESFNIYARADGSYYEENQGSGDPILSSINECQTSTEERLEGNIKATRTVTKYPDGHVEYGSWH